MTIEMAFLQNRTEKWMKVILIRENARKIYFFLCQIWQFCHKRLKTSSEGLSVSCGMKYNIKC